MIAAVSDYGQNPPLQGEGDRPQAGGGVSPYREGDTPPAGFAIVNEAGDSFALPLQARIEGRIIAAATILVAALACLQPGIDPVFLTLLSSAHGIDPVDHGWVVGATQAAMALGSLVAWRAGSRLPRGTLPVAALMAALAGAATVQVQDSLALIAMRALYGLAMGLVYTQAMSSAAASRPTGAYGAVFLIQLILSTVVALVLPALAEARSAGFALGALVAGPMLILLLTRMGAAGRASEVGVADQRSATSPSGWALAAATFFFICTTMMVWSFTGALAVAAGIGEAVIGNAVAIGSLVGAATAVVVMRDRPWLPLPLSGLICGLFILAPVVMTPSGDAWLFVAAVILLNIGSTAMVIRCSGLASASSSDTLFRRFVACTHSLGMIAGPVLGSILSNAAGPAGLQTGAVLTLGAALLALALAALWLRTADAAPQKNIAHRGGIA